VVVSFLLFLSNPIVSDQTGNHHTILTTDGTLPLGKILPFVSGNLQFSVISLGYHYLM